MSSELRNTLRNSISGMETRLGIFIRMPQQRCRLPPPIVSKRHYLLSRDPPSSLSWREKANSPTSSSFFSLYPSLEEQTWVKSGYFYAGSEIPVSDIDSSLFSHLICAFASTDPSTHPLSFNSSFEQIFSTFTSTVKRKNPSVTTLLSVWAGGEDFSDLASMLGESSSRRSFIQSTIEKLEDSSADAIGHPAVGPAETADGSFGYKAIKSFIRDFGYGTSSVYNGTYMVNFFRKGLVNSDQNWVLSKAAEEASEDRQERRWFRLVMLISIAIVVLLIFGLIWYLKRRTLRSKGISGVIKGFSRQFKTMVCKGESLESGAPNLQTFGYATLRAATDNFSSENKLGQGGFGPVYKGKLPKGQDIAIKRLSKTSNQGLEAFKNEVMLATSLQHVNLVRLLGFCIDREEKLLINEYMPNKSLDFYLFDPIRKYWLDWVKRVHIIEGITQGLLYLQEYSNFTIIHRDLKASNVLLDDEMNPKISDFGLARIFRKDDLEANTNRIVGTYGYVPPEYVRKGMYSMKYDVYSFGVLMLQIISGKRTSCYYGLNENLTLLEYAYELWKDNRCMEFIDPSLDDSSSSCKLVRCMQVALLCVQEKPGDRPSMLEVSSMLKNEFSALNFPKKPAFSINKDEDEDDKCLLKEAIHSVNDASISELFPR
ncbi:hypothetical protein NL676_012341 [Syzygium grande]|nr:hypothetical protein NL676_012341 [Syzygium grande]